MNRPGRGEPPHRRAARRGPEQLRGAPRLGEARDGQLQAQGNTYYHVITCYYSVLGCYVMLCYVIVNSLIHYIHNVYVYIYIMIYNYIYIYIYTHVYTHTCYLSLSLSP